MNSNNNTKLIIDEYPSEQKKIKNLHEELIKLLKEQTPTEENPVNVLMESLNISKEAAYRRLRGEIQLTLDEAIILAKKLEVSLDNLLEIYWENKYTFHISPIEINSSIKEYHKTLSEIIYAYDYIKSDPACCTYIIGKLLSPTLYFKYKEFSKFTLFKWIYLVQDSNKYTTLSDVIVPPNLEQLYKPFMDAAIQIPTTYILNDFLFTSIMNDLNYYYKINLLTRDDIAILKEQTILIINDLEDIAERGTYKGGAEVSIYIADTYFDISYNYVSGNHFEACGIGVYGLNFLSCQHPKIVQYQKSWIESLIRHSTSISRSGESQRMIFFKRQREKINSIIC